MDLIFPDTPEYHFVLKRLCSDQFASYPKFLCNPVSEFDDYPSGDVVFAPSPLAIMNSDRYLILSTGNIFSYFSGPVVLSSEEGYDHLFVRESDFVSRYYAKILLNTINVVKGEGFPCILEPRLALLSADFGRTKDDLYKKWETIAPTLPIPLYTGLIRKEMRELKGIVEEAMKASIRYSFDKSSEAVKDIAASFFIENSELLKRVLFHFVNKSTLSIGKDEIDALKVLRERINGFGYSVPELKF